jgi:hypothetical protein
MLMSLQNLTKRMLLANEVAFRNRTAKQREEMLHNEEEAVVRVGACRAAAVDVLASTLGARTLCPQAYPLSLGSPCTCTPPLYPCTCHAPRHTLSGIWQRLEAEVRKRRLRAMEAAQSKREFELQVGRTPFFPMYT